MTIGGITLFAPLKVFVDFDGTITTQDTLEVLMQSLCEPAYRELEDKWVAGEMGSKEILPLQLPLVAGGWPAMLRELDGFAVDPTFKGFAVWLRSLDIPLYVVSDGFDFIIKHILGREGLLEGGLIAGIKTNQIDLHPDGSMTIQFPFSRADEAKPCRSGTCKCLAVESEKPVKSVVVGDGLSDRCWAGFADILFAKGRLADYCQRENLSFRNFQNFADVQGELISLEIID